MMDKLFSGHALLTHYTLAGLGLVIGTVALTLYAAGYFNPPVETGPSPLAGRDFTIAPFDIHDAAGVCQQEALEKLGPSLVRATPDWHSSRLESSRDIYFIALNADVGDIYRHEAAFVYCYVDPDDYVVTYFKAYDSEERSLLSKFSFGDILKALDTTMNK